MICPICNKRRAERYCPAKGEKICAIDCGTEREVTIDCPSDCSYLLAAHRWEQSHPKPLAPSDIPFPDVLPDEDLVHTRQDLLSGLVYTILTYAMDQPSLTDANILRAGQAMAETYKTLVAGIYYEKPPQDHVAAGLYAVFGKYIAEEKKRLAERSGPLKEGEIFQVLVIFLRLARLRSNGRPRTRSFLEYLRSQFPLAPESAAEEPRIIVP